MQNKKILCYYYDDVPNFGDMLNINLFNFFGKEITKGTIKNSDIIGIGSLLQKIYTPKKTAIINKFSKYYKKPLIVYGSGFIEDIPLSQHPLRKVYVTAVRGIYSYEKLKSFGNAEFSKKLAIGDPGLLAKHFINTSNIKKEFDLGIIPHYVDKQNPLIHNQSISNSVIIDIQQDPESFLYQVAKCKTILSSAMHGLIAADSLGIPNARLILSDKIIGGDYKYNDYYSAFGITNHFRIDLRKDKISNNTIQTIINQYQISQKQVDEICSSLISAFPIQ